MNETTLAVFVALCNAIEAVEKGDKITADICIAQARELLVNESKDGEESETDKTS